MVHIARIAIIAVMTCGPVMAQESVQIGITHEKYGATIVTLRETDVPNAVAEVHIHDAYVNRPQDDGPYPLDLDGLIVTVLFTYSGVGADTFEVIPPEGYMAWPPILSVPEHESEIVLIYPEGLS